MRGWRESRRDWRRTIQPLLVTAAGLWLLFTVLVVAGIHPVSASPRQASSSSIALVDTTTPGATVVATDTPTAVVPTATDTPVPAATDTPVPADTPTDTPVPDTGGGGGGGGGSNGDTGGGGGSSGAAPDVTRVVFSQPTVAAGNDSAVPGLAGATFGSNGLLLATSLSCVAGLLGLTVAGIALSMLMRRGYGPFLRALLRGKRAGMGAGLGRGKRGKDVSYDEYDGYDLGDGMSAGPGRSGWRGGSSAHNAAGSNSRASASRGQQGQQRQPSMTRSRGDWR